MHCAQTDGCRYLLARLVVVYSIAIGANRIISRNGETPTDTICAIWDVNSECTSPYPINDLHHKISDRRAEKLM